MVKPVRLCLVCLLALMCSCSLASGKKAAKYTTNYVKTKPYYHIMFALSANNIVAMDELDRAAFDKNGGQFEIRIDKGEFPINAPSCKSNIILRMPWVKDGTGLDEKYELYETILSIYKQRSHESILVALELNPYVEKKEQEIFLTQCNVFFRHAKGHYIPNVQPLDAN